MICCKVSPNVSVRGSDSLKTGLSRLLYLSIKSLMSLLSWGPLCTPENTIKISSFSKEFRNQKFQSQDVIGFSNQGVHSKKSGFLKVVLQQKKVIHGTFQNSPRNLSLVKKCFLRGEIVHANRQLSCNTRFTQNINLSEATDGYFTQSLRSNKVQKQLSRQLFLTIFIDVESMSDLKAKKWVICSFELIHYLWRLASLTSVVENLHCRGVKDGEIYKKSIGRRFFSIPKRNFSFGVLLMTPIQIK